MPTLPHPGTSVKRIVHANRAELVALSLAALGIFLLVEPFNIRLTLLAWLGAATLKFQQGVDSFLTRLTHLHSSDIVGFCLVIASGSFIYWRSRVRLLRSGRLEASDCPRCHKPIHRIHRTPFDHFLGKILQLPLRRYWCRECGWKGLRLRRHGDHQPSPKPEYVDSN